MPETPEQLDELFSRRLAAITSAAPTVKTPTRVDPLLLRWDLESWSRIIFSAPTENCKI